MSHVLASMDGRAARTSTNVRWAHLLSVSNGAQASHYLDGYLVRRVAVAFSQSPLDKFYIGQEFASFDRYWGGRIDEVRLYGTALDPAQINLLFRDYSAE